jgi:hypothetical protein
VGNTQSQPVRNWGNFEIIGREKHTGRVLKDNQEYSFIRFHLNETIDYKNGQFNRIDVNNQLPFKKYRIGDFLKIDLDVIRKNDSGYCFDDTNVIMRGSWGTNTLKKHGGTVAKGAVGVGLTAVNEFCPKVGEIANSATQLTGTAANFLGSVSGNENLAKFGEVMSDGAHAGSFMSGVRNLPGRETHVKDCLKWCKDEKFKKVVKGTGITANVAEQTVEIARIVLEDRKFFKN